MNTYNSGSIPPSSSSSSTPQRQQQQQQQQQQHPTPQLAQRRRLQYWITQAWRGPTTTTTADTTEIGKDNNATKRINGSDHHHNNATSVTQDATVIAVVSERNMMGVWGVTSQPQEESLQQQQQQQQRSRQHRPLGRSVEKISLSSSALVDIRRRPTIPSGTGNEMTTTRTRTMASPNRPHHHHPNHHQHRSPITPASLSLTVPNPATTIVNNIDQALDALSFYNNDVYFPVVVGVVAGDGIRNGNENDSVEGKDRGKEKVLATVETDLPQEDPNDIVEQPSPTSLPFDWILDGYPEWYGQYAKTNALFQQMANAVPNLSTSMSKEEEELFLWQFGGGVGEGGGWGQQQYQFATFPPPDDDDDNNAHHDDNADHADNADAFAADIKPSKAEGNTTTTIPTTTIVHDEKNIHHATVRRRMQGGTDEDDKDSHKHLFESSRLSVPTLGVDPNQVGKDGTSEGGQYVDNDDVVVPSALISTPPLQPRGQPRQKQQQQQRTIEAKDGSPGIDSSSKSTTNTAEESQQQQQQQNHSEPGIAARAAATAAAAAAVTTLAADSGGSATTMVTNTDGGTHHDSHQKLPPPPTTTTTAAASVSTASVVITSPSQTQDFEQFWQAAVAAPTPDGTFDSLDSKSTYQTPSLNDDAIVQNFHSAKSPSNTKVLPIPPPPPPLTLEFLPDDNEERQTTTDDPATEDDDDDDDFGDFQEATPATVTPSSSSPFDHIAKPAECRNLEEQLEPLAGCGTAEVVAQQPLQVAANPQEDVDNDDDDGDDDDHVAVACVVSNSEHVNEGNGDTKNESVLEEENVRSDDEYQRPPRDLGEVTIHVAVIGTMTVTESANDPATAKTETSDISKSAAFHTPSKLSEQEPSQDVVLGNRFVDNYHHDGFLEPELPASPVPLRRSPTSPFMHVVASKPLSANALAATASGLHTPRASPPSVDDNERKRTTQLEPPTPITKNYSSPDGANPALRRRLGKSTGRDPLGQEEDCSTPQNGDEYDGSAEDEDGTRAESLFTDASNQSSIPSVVQLFTKSVQSQAPSSLTSPSIIVPQTVRLASATRFSSSFNFGSNGKTRQRQLSLITYPYGDLDDEPSIASSLASPEVKFLRRRKSQNLLPTPRGDATDDDENDETALDEQELMSLGSLVTLPDQYWKYPELDHTLNELKKLEWDWLPFWKMGRLLDETDGAGNAIDTDTVSLLQDQITQRLSELDAFYGKVCKKVYRKIQPHAEELILANQAALDLQRNLQLAQMYLGKSQKSIHLAKYGSVLDSRDDFTPAVNPTDGLGIYGAVQLLALWDTQASYQDLNLVLGVIRDVYDLENQLLQRIEEYDASREDSIEECHVILQRIQDLKDKLDARPAISLDCLTELRHRVDSLVSVTFARRLHSCLEAEAAKSCLSSRASLFDKEAYSRLVEVMLLVRRSSTAPDVADRAQSFVGAFCTSIHTALLLEAQKSFGRSLLDPTDSENEATKFEQELLALTNHLANLDSTRLSGWTQNLSTIRFDLEVNQSHKLPLPAVFHKQCWVLANVLHRMFRLIEWHGIKATEDDTITNDDETKDLLSRIHVQLQTRRASVWNACVQSLEECLEEYLKLSGTKHLFQWKDNKYDDSCWLEDLIGLEDVAGLIDQFLSLGTEFLEGIPAEVVNDGSMIREKFRSVMKRHVRTLHVEAMNTMGNALYREEWTLTDIDDAKTVKDSDACTGDYMFKIISNRLSEHFLCKPTFRTRSKQNGFARVSEGRHLSSFLFNGNPFGVEPAAAPEAHVDKAILSHGPSCWNDAKGGEILELMKTFVLPEDLRTIATTNSILGWLIPWTSRLLFLMEKLPSLFGEACGVMRNIYDLYCTTVFRLCAGNSGNERILLGMVEDKAKAKSTHEQMSRVAQRASSPNFGFGLRSQSYQKPSRPAPILSRHVDAELCALVPVESDLLPILRGLILDAQRSLQGIAKLDLVDGWIADPFLHDDTVEEDFAQETARVLEKRQAACWSYISLAVALHTATAMLARDSTGLKEYSYRLIQSLPILIQLSSRISCMRAIRGRTLVKEILSVGGGWEESKLHEHPNEYVDSLCDFMALVWYNLTTSSNGLPRGILQAVWGDLVGGGYMVLLDAFAKVPFCSTEGRALMSMDLASYASGTRFQSIASRLEDYPQVNLIFRDFTVSSYRNMTYVDTYIKLFYFPSTDAIEWIESNFRDYHKHHMIALALSTARDEKEGNRMLKRVEQCYGDTSGKV